MKDKDFDYSAIQYHGKTKNYKKQQPEEDWENEGGGVRYDDHIVGSIPIKKVYPNIFASPNDWVYDTNNCTEKIELDLPDQDILQLAMIAHDRDITLNHLINEVLHDKIQRDFLQHSR